MTHDKIANLMGVSRPHISKISKGVKRPDVVVSNNPTIKRLILLEYFDGNYTLRDL
jgi:transcriptional regulator with XRE-family HTH domain